MSERLKYPLDGIWVRCEMANYIWDRLQEVRATPKWFGVGSPHVRDYRLACRHIHIYTNIGPNCFPCFSLKQTAVSQLSGQFTELAAWKVLGRFM